MLLSCRARIARVIFPPPTTEDGTMVEQTDLQAEPRVLTEQELALLVTMFRQAHGWSQETLAELAGLSARTVQRVERAEPSSPDTRRALARAFEMEDIDTLNKGHVFKTQEQINREAEEFQRGHVTLDLKIARSGKELAAFVAEINAHSFQVADGAPRAVTETAAALFDYMVDFGDVDELYSFTDRLKVDDDFDASLKDIGRAGWSICYATRRASFVGSTWENKTPLPMTIGYVLLTPKGKEPGTLAIPKGVPLRFGT
jgi:transcriptional regulator with XRE-family HTH domain